MKTKAESKSILDDWVASKTDSTENPNFGFVETFYQTCSAALVSLWKSQFRATKPSPPKGTLKKDIASIRLWEENFPSGHLDTILAESSGLKTAVLENLTGIGKILVPYFKDGDDTISNTIMESMPERNFARELEMQLEKAALMVDPDETSDPSSDDETSDDSFSITERHQNRLGRLHSYTSCLLDLAPVVEKYICSLQYRAEVQSVPSETVSRLSHRAQPYAMRIRDRLTHAPTSLVERLAEANLERSIRLRTQDDDEEEVDDESHRDAVTLLKPFSIFHDSGLGASISKMSQYAATVASHTSFLSVGGEEVIGRPRVPPLPHEGGSPFQCDYCHRTISIRDRIEWKMHVFADLQSYICTHESCKDALKTFPTRKLWADHEFNEHFTLLQWRCFTCRIAFMPSELFVQHLVQVHGVELTGNRLAAVISESRESILTTDFKNYKCLLCSQDGWETKKAYATHVGRHLEEISLASLPRDEDDSSEDRSDTDISITPNNNDEPPFSNREGSQIDDKPEAKYRPSMQPPPIPKPVPSRSVGEVIKSYSDEIRDMASPDKTSHQDMSSTLLPNLSLSNEHSAGFKSLRPSSYWSVAERNDFKPLLAHFGKDFAAISGSMKTKTPVMVRNYYNRQIAAGEIDLEKATKDADAKRARGEHPQTHAISNAAARPEYPMEMVRIEQQERDKLKRERLESPQQQSQLPTPDHSNPAKTKSGAQQPVPQELERNDLQVQDAWQKIRIKALLEKQNNQPLAITHSDHSKGQRERDYLMPATRSSTSLGPKKNGLSPEERSSKREIEGFESDDARPFSSQAWSNYTLGMKQDTASTQTIDASAYMDLQWVPPLQGDTESSMAPTMPSFPFHNLSDPLPDKLLEGLMDPPPVPHDWSAAVPLSNPGQFGRSRSEEYMPPDSDENDRRRSQSSRMPCPEASATYEPDANQSSHRPYIRSEPGLNKFERTKPLYRCLHPRCNVPSRTRAAFKRHIATKHYPQCDFICRFDNCLLHFRRRDKLLNHYHSFHMTDPSPGEIDDWKVSLPSPISCALCSATVQSWDEFYKCFTNHCEVKEVREVIEGGEERTEELSRVTI